LVQLVLSLGVVKGMREGRWQGRLQDLLALVDVVALVLQLVPSLVLQVLRLGLLLVLFLGVVLVGFVRFVWVDGQSLQVLSLVLPWSRRHRPSACSLGPVRGCGMAWTVRGLLVPSRGHPSLPSLCPSASVSVCASGSRFCL